MTRLLALVDGSTYSESVCDHAAWLARQTDAQVTVIHVLGHRQGVKSDLSGNIGLGARTALLEELAELDAAKAKLAQKRGRAILEDAKARIEQDGVAQVETRLRIGDLVETLQEAEAETDILVVGKRGEAAAAAKTHLGSNLERAVRASDKPVFVANRAFKPVQRVTLYFDGGASALKAVDHMSRHPILSGLELTVLGVGPETPDRMRGVEGATAMLKGGGLNATAKVVTGVAEQILPDIIRDDNTDLLVMPAYQRSRLHNMIIPSTTAAIMQACQIPLLLFR